MAERKFFVGQDELEATYRKLGSAAAVAAHYGVSKKLVLTYMKRYGIAKLPRRVIDADVGAVIERMARNFSSAKAIADVVGFSTTAIRKYAKARGIQIRDPYHVGYITTDSGYIKRKVPGHPRADRKGYVMEHVLVMEAHLGRLLTDDEVVHHVDYDKSNNELCNLQLMTDKEHRALHLSAKDCGRWMKRRTQQDIV